MKANIPNISADAAAAELCRRRLSFFVKEFWEILIAEEMVWGLHMDIMCNEVQRVFERVFMRYDADGNMLGRQKKLYDLIINVPPGTSKSTIITQMAPVWAWTRDPTLRIITGSYSGSLSTEHAVKSRDIIRSPKFRTYFPEIAVKPDEDGKTNFKNLDLGQRYATSVGGTITGIHAHMIIIDDPLNPKQAASLVEIEAANNWNDTTLSTRKVDKAVTPQILVMQRLAEKDLTGHLLGKKGYKVRHVCLPAELAANVAPKEYRAVYKDGLLDPIRMPKDVLEDMAIQLGPAQYAGQFGQSPVPQGGLIWKKWFIEVPDEAFPPRHMMTDYGTDWDLAYTADESNSANAYMSAGRIGDKRYIDDFGFAWNEFPEQIAWMKTKTGPHYIEAKASGKSAKSTLVAQGIAAIEVKVVGGDKEARANMATALPAAGLVYIRKSLADRLYNDKRQGILFFPKGEHNDVADVLAQCMQRLSAGSGIIAGKTHDDEDGDWDNWDD